MANWFGDLQLAYKYCVVFGALLLLTILAGCVKVLYDRRKLKKHTKEQENVEAGRKDDQMELNQREKDEGDLFGIRAIEAGFYAGIPQSRPTSRAGSYAESQTRSTSTLIGGASLALKDHALSMNSSVTTLPLAHTAGDRDSSNSNSPPRRKSPPAIRLAPSEAELNGRLNHNAAVNMNLNVPPSPVFARGPQSPSFGGSDSGDSDGQTSPRSLSPRSPNFRPDHYSPRAPQIPMPQGLTVSLHPAEDMPRSEAASFNMDSAPSSRGPTPEARLPTLPNITLSDGPRTLYPTGHSKPEPERPSSPVRLLPQTYQPAHQRDMSNASSVYSMNRNSTHQPSNSTDSTYNFSFPENSSRNSVTLSSSKDDSRRPSASSSLLAPGSASTTNQQSDPRFSEFYDAYYRNSMLPPAASTDASKRPGNLNLQETITEVDTPLPSPNPNTPFIQPGAAI